MHPSGIGILCAVYKLLMMWLGWFSLAGTASASRRVLNHRPACAQQYALGIILLRSHGRSGVKGPLLGSVPAAVSKSCEFPVLFVK